VQFPQLDGKDGIDVARTAQDVADTGKFYAILNSRANDREQAKYPFLDNSAGWRPTLANATIQCAAGVQDRIVCVLGRFSGLYSMCAGWAETLVLCCVTC
jgi:hypothetical protein